MYKQENDVNDMHFTNKHFLMKIYLSTSRVKYPFHTIKRNYGVSVFLSFKTFQIEGFISINAKLNAKVENNNNYFLHMEKSHTLYS